MRSIQATLNRCKTGEYDMAKEERKSFLKFLSKVPMLSDKISESIYGTDTFTKLLQSLDIINLKRCQYVYRKGQPIEHVFYVIKGEIL